MYSQKKKDATQRKTLKHAGYKSIKKVTDVDAWLQHLNLHKQNALTNILKHHS